MAPMTKRYNPLERRKNKRKQRRLVYVLTEGQTEVDYLKQQAIQDWIRDSDTVSMKLLQKHPGRTDPSNLVRTMKTVLKSADFRRSDEAWIAFDIDQWNDEQVSDALNWAAGDSRYSLAISNPKFEVFLLMHFENAAGCTTAALVDARLKRAWGDSDFKRLPSTKFSFKAIELACERSEHKLTFVPAGIPAPGTSQMHLLVYRLLGK